MKSKIPLLLIDILLLSASFFVSIVLFGFKIESALLWYVIFLGVQLFLFVRYGLYRAILKFAGMPLAATIIKATSLSSGVIFLISNLSTLKLNPLNFIIVDYLATTFLIGLARFAPRYLSERRRSEGTRRILIYGAGSLGEEVSRRLFRESKIDYQLIGFIDDDLNKRGKRIHNLPILGTKDELKDVALKKDVSELIVAIAGLKGEQIRDITRICRRSHIICRIVPSLPDTLNKDVAIKDIDISDLLKRDPKDLDELKIRSFIKNKSILITGAGGSIGSELARQCVRYGASRLILVDHSEYNIYALREELIDLHKSLRFSLCNVMSKRSFEKIIKEERPSILFHAAACKHVPIVEDNPSMGVSTNVMGTMEVAQLAEMYGVEKFVLISTDKAVRPTNIMGATKRVAELFIQNFNLKSNTEFIAVRFGNVLGSSGSVVPKFIEQINKGGPVTVTHPDVTRFFMLVSEAVQLVLQAASIGQGGEIFILNMGEPVRISEMAEDLIFLSGREPHKDIKIEYVGLRPGEKLYEEILIGESEKKTQYENITVGRSTYLNWDWLQQHIDILLEYSRNHDRMGILAAIKAIVPEFQHASLKQIQDSSSEEFISLSSIHFPSKH